MEQRAPELYQLAQTVMGHAGLDAWLHEQLQLHPQLRDLFKNDVWRKIDGGPIIDRLCELCTQPSMALDAAMPSGQDLINSEQSQVLLFNSLLQLLPVDHLSEPLLERRLALDLGL